MIEDPVETILSQWRRERPDLDPAAMGIIGRISRLHTHIRKALETNFKRHKLQGSTFDVLATLRRHGEPFALTPTQLQAEMMLSSGATTHRIDLLEKQSWIERLPDPTDRRGVLIKLTASGKALIDEAIITHIETEEKLLDGLTTQQRAELADLLKQFSQLLDPA